MAEQSRSLNVHVLHAVETSLVEKAELFREKDPLRNAEAETKVKRSVGLNALVVNTFGPHDSRNRRSRVRDIAGDLKL